MERNPIPENALQVTFAGVGEAFDERLPNTSILVEAAGTSLLLDCGFTAASAFWRAAADPLNLDGVYITHFHGDHFFGLPALLVRSVDEGRTRPLTILGQPEVEHKVRSAMELAYEGVLAKSALPLSFVACQPDQPRTIGGLTLDFAYGDHPRPCLGVRVSGAGCSVFYSGDGRPTPATAALAAGCDLVVHESFSLDPDTPGHGTIGSSVEFARKAGVPRLALVHVQRGVRHGNLKEIQAAMEQAQELDVLLPEPGDKVVLQRKCES
jgi:ribonuclease Z